MLILSLALFEEQITRKSKNFFCLLVFSAGIMSSSSVWMLTNIKEKNKDKEMVVFLRKLEDKILSELASGKDAILQTPEEIKQHIIAKAEANKCAAILEAEGMLQVMRLISSGAKHHSEGSEIIRCILTMKYIEANAKVASSNNSKVLFMDPGSLDSAITDLLGPPGFRNQPNSSHSSPSTQNTDMLDDWDKYDELNG